MGLPTLGVPITLNPGAEWRKARVNIDYHIQVDGHIH